MTYTVTALNMQNRVVCAPEPTERKARTTAKTWRKDAALRNVQIVSRDEYGRGHVMEVK